MAIFVLLVICGLSVSFLAECAFDAIEQKCLPLSKDYDHETTKRLGVIKGQFISTCAFLTGLLIAVATR